MSSVRVLIVEDFEPFRRFIASTLHKHPDLQIVGEVSDGFEAVQKAKELQPDLILLDIGLPILGGIEAARRISRIALGSKLLFLTLYKDQDLVRAALRTGAKGYVLKTDAGAELLLAVEAVLAGHDFVSTGIKREDGHIVQFYTEDGALLDSLSASLGTVLRDGESALLFATKPHRNWLEMRLKAEGIDLDCAVKNGRYVALDSADTLATLMDDTVPNQSAFLSLTGPLIRRAEAAAASGHKRVSVFGEMVALLWNDKRYEGAIRLERLWNELARTHRFCLHCAYPLGGFDGPQKGQLYATICAEHSAIVSA